jgi:membrane protein implicated in regulation of membrane protease activity
MINIITDIAILILLFFLLLRYDLICLFCYFGNQLSHKFGLQKKVVVGSEYLGRKVKIVSVDSEGVRVEADGSTWNAIVPTGFVPIAGQCVIITKVDGLTFYIEKSET